MPPACLHHSSQQLRDCPRPSEPEPQSSETQHILPQIKSIWFSFIYT